MAQVGPKNGDTWTPVLPKRPSHIPPQEVDPLTVFEVVIDKEAENAVVAREKALEAIPELAFQKFAADNMGADAAKGVKAPKDVGALVADFEVSGEQMSATRYVGKFTVRFRESVRNYVTVKEPEIVLTPPSSSTSTGAGTDVAAADASVDVTAETDTATGHPDVERDMPSAAAASATIVAATEPLPRFVLVLPYFENAAGQTVLWEDPNPWRKVWETALPRMPEDGTQFFVSLGDINDMAAGPVNGVWSGDYTMVERLRRNYSAGAVALLVANKADKALNVDVYVYVDGRLQRRGSLHPYVGEDIAGGWHQAMAASLEYLRRAPTSRAQPRVEQISRDIVVSYTGGHTTTIIDSAGGRVMKPGLQVSAQPYIPGAVARPVSNSPQPVYAPVAAVPGLDPVTGAYVARTQIDAEMRFQQLSAWTEMQKRLHGLTVDVKSLSSAGAAITVSFDGPPGALRSALAARGVVMDGPYPGGSYSLALSN
ncbi:MAG: hypothetical protein ACAH80_16375 [Alphaproteobacteria bacterium]